MTDWLGRMLGQLRRIWGRFGRITGCFGRMEGWLGRLTNWLRLFGEDVGWLVEYGSFIANSLLVSIKKNKNNKI